MSKMGPKRLLRDPLTLSGAFLCLGVLILSRGWFFLPASAEEGAIPETGFTHLHCPSCSTEIPYTPSKDGKPCEFCVVGSPLIATTGSVKSNGSSGSNQSLGRIFGFTVFAGLLVEMVWILGVHRLRVLRKREDSEWNRTQTCRCPFCNQKIRFAERNNGTGVLCSRCKTAFTLESDGTQPEE